MNYICPICHSLLINNEKNLRCENNHSFDFASSGYINLLKPGKKNNAKAGDSKEMIRARSDFFKCGAYQRIADKVCEIVTSFSPSIVVDAGCGEGYYTQALASANKSTLVLGFDMSKFGCEHGAKVARRTDTSNVFYAVGNIFNIPLNDASADVIVNMFAPVASEEFARLLAKGGHLVVASAGVDHLDGLKRVIYENAYKNEEKILDYEGFILENVINLKYDVTIFGNETVKNLFTMTPYYHRTSLLDKEKLDSVDSIQTTVEVNFAIYLRI